VLVACGLLYLGIGREVIQLTRARKDAAAMEMRTDLHQLNTDIERIGAAARLSSASEIVSPIAFTSAAALAANGDSDDVDAWLSGEPVETLSWSQYAER
jgi:hypothetical protein